MAQAFSGRLLISLRRFGLERSFYFMVLDVALVTLCLQENLFKFEIFSSDDFSK